MNESDGESATEYTNLMTSFVNSQYSQMDRSLQPTLVNSAKERMPQPVSDPSISGRTEMYSPVRNVWCFKFAKQFIYAFNSTLLILLFIKGHVKKVAFREIFSACQCSAVKYTPIEYLFGGLKENSNSTWILFYSMKST